MLNITCPAGKSTDPLLLDGTFLSLALSLLLRLSRNGVFGVKLFIWKSLQ